MISQQSLEREFDKYYFSMCYDEAMQVVGKMQIENYTKQARYCELLIYYEQKKFDKIRKMLRYKTIKRQEERELYLCSLLELQLYDEFYKEYDSLDLISKYCFGYMVAIQISQGIDLNEMSKRGLKCSNVSTKESTYMSRRYKWFVAKSISDIYLINEEKIQMIEAGLSEEDINYLREILDRKFESVRFYDATREKIFKQVNNDEHILLDDVLWFPVIYNGNNRTEKFNPIQCFDTIYDIVNYLDICRRIDHDLMILSGIIDYGEKLFEAIRDGNPYVIEEMKKIYIDICLYNNNGSNKKLEAVSNKINFYLKKYAPYVIEEVENHAQDKKIIAVLSTKGKFAYKAALWQFENSMSSDYGTTDAGMLCLSYMRILELEINEWLIDKLQQQKNEINKAFFGFLNEFDGAEKVKHEKNWSFVMTGIRKEEGLELGTVYAILDSMRISKFNKNNPDCKMSEILRSFLKKYLTSAGASALENGIFADMVAPKVRNKYRNPPAHTRYVRLEVALECREYVEHNLLRLYEFIIH